MKSRLKSFTLIEVMTVMLLSSIVISTAMLSYDLINRQFVSYSKMNEKLLQAVKLNTLLNVDFFKAQYIRFSNEEIQFIQQEQNGISYQFQTDYITRTMGDAVDTFFISVQNMEAMMLKEKVEQGEKLIDELSFEVVSENEIKKIHFQKKYGADMLMSMEEVK